MRFELFFTMDSERRVSTCFSDKCWRTEDKNPTTKQKKKKVWTKPWLLRRNHFGFYNNLHAEFRLEEEEILISKILTTHSNQGVTPCSNLQFAKLFLSLYDCVMYIP